MQWLMLCQTLTVLVLGKCNIFVIGGVQNPEDRVQVVAAEQIWSGDAALPRRLQLLQLLN